MSFLQDLAHKRTNGQKALAVLIDPDRWDNGKKSTDLIELINHSKVDYIFIGGSLLVENYFHQCVAEIKAKSKVPVVLFPGSPTQISDHADALLFLSLISGRNAELLIGHHVTAAPQLSKMALEIVPTGYMLIDCGNSTTASYISQTFPIPYNKPEIAAATALAGQMLGLKCMYLDGGSGASKPVSVEMIEAVKRSTLTPLIVGGGVRNEVQAEQAFEAGADLLVVGTAFEEEPELLFSMARARKGSG